MILAAVVAARVADAALARAALLLVLMLMLVLVLCLLQQLLLPLHCAMLLPKLQRAKKYSGQSMRRCAAPKSLKILVTMNLRREKASSPSENPRARTHEETRRGRGCAPLRARTRPRHGRWAAPRSSSPPRARPTRRRHVPPSCARDGAIL